MREPNPLQSLFVATVLVCLPHAGMLDREHIFAFSALSQ